MARQPRDIPCALPPPTLPAARRPRRTSHEPQAPQADSQQGQGADPRFAPGFAPPVPHALHRGGPSTCSKENMMLNWLRCYQNSMAKINLSEKQKGRRERGDGLAHKQEKTAFRNRDGKPKRRRVRRRQRRGAASPNPAAAAPPHRRVRRDLYQCIRPGSKQGARVSPPALWPSHAAKA